MPKRQVDNIVTKRVLDMDKGSCDNLLNAILEQKKSEDMKQNIIQRERQLQRNKLAIKHNLRIEQAERLGVKINSKLAKTVRNAQGNFTIGTDSLEQNSINGISDIQKLSQINKAHKKFGAGEYSFMQNNDQNSFLSGLETGRSLQTQRIKQ